MLTLAVDCQHIQARSNRGKGVIQSPEHRGHVEAQLIHVTSSKKVPSSYSSDYDEWGFVMFLLASFRITRDKKECLGRKESDVDGRPADVDQRALFCLSSPPSQDRATGAHLVPVCRQNASRVYRMVALLFSEHFLNFYNRTHADTALPT